MSAKLGGEEPRRSSVQQEDSSQSNVKDDESSSTEDNQTPTRETELDSLEQSDCSDSANTENQQMALSTSAKVDATTTNKINESFQTKESKSDDDIDVKPSHSYIALIAMAILSCANNKMILGDIYQYISDHYPYYRNKDKSWRNSIRHNLSLNECFIKAGRSENGKGNYWAIHPANLEDFSNGDFRRRRARRRVRKSNALKFTNGVPSGFPYLRGYTPLASYSSFLPYKGSEDRYYSGGYPSYLPSVNRKSFAIDNIMSPTNYKQYHPYPVYDPPCTSASAYPTLLSSTNNAAAIGYTPLPASIGAERGFSGPYSSSLSALASLSHSYRGNESWQDTLCKLQEKLKKPSNS